MNPLKRQIQRLFSHKRNALERTENIYTRKDRAGTDAGVRWREIMSGKHLSHFPPLGGNQANVNLDKL
jgi:hypothetical protein